MTPNMAFIALSLVLASAAWSQTPPPPIGPPVPVATAQELLVNLLITNARDASGKNIGVRGQVDAAIAAVNVNAAQQTRVRAKVKVESFTVAPVTLGATTYTDRPNHRHARMSYRVGYKVYEVRKSTSMGWWLPTTITRHLSHPIDIHVSCDGWETGRGKLKLETRIGTLSMDSQQGTAEAVVDFFLNGQLTGFIDAQVRQMIGGVAFRNASASLAMDCNTLGVDAGVVADVADDVVRYSMTPVKPTPTTALGEVRLTLLTVKRLRARNLQGQPLYAASEAPALEVFTNHRSARVQLPELQEGQQVAVTASPIVLPRTGLASLSVLVNVRQANLTQVDSAYQVYDKAIDFGNGTQTIRVRKSYWTVADPARGSKPQQVFTDGYELVFRINALDRMVTTGRAAPGVRRADVRQP